MRIKVKVAMMDLKEKLVHVNPFTRLNGKKITSLCLLVVMMLSGAALGLSAYASLPRYGVVTASGLTLRERASTKSDSILVIPKGGLVRVYRQSNSDEDWYQVSFGDQEGYVMSQYLRYNVTQEEIDNAKKVTKAKATSKKVKIPASSLRKGDSGQYVKNMQTQLSTEGYEIMVDGKYGLDTKAAVEVFQENNDLKVDGIAGIKTLTTLYDGNVIVVDSDRDGESGDEDNNAGSNEGDVSGDKKNEVTGKVTMPDWWSEASKTFGRGDVATVTDVKTGLSYQVKRYGGTNHADCEPLTEEDAKIMKKIYGGSWSWNRRAIIVEVNGETMAASQNGMPHGGSSIKDNGFNGHFCIHFKNSRTHGSNRVCSKHQACVKAAYDAYN